MASQGVAANSRLAEMQMRFQKKQLQEREQKKLALTGSESSSETSVASRNALGNGKVRQMFQQRRGVGIDRSHPLKPITTTTTTVATNRTATQQPPATMRRLTGGSTTTTTTRRTGITTKQTSTSSMRNSHSHPNTFSSNGNLFGSDLDEMDNLESETFPKEFSSLSLDNTRILGAAINDGNNNSRSANGMGKDVMNSTITISKKSTPSTNGIRLNPVITKKSPNNTATRTAAQPRSPGSASRVSTTSRTSTTTTTKSPVKRTTTVGSTAPAKGVKTTSRAVNGKPATFVMAVKPPPRITTPPAGMAACPYCYRHFNEDRLAKHEDVCRKMVTTKRKIFDASKHRVQGTEAEKYLRKGKGAPAPKPTAVAAATSPATADSSKKSNWRKKHEEFINAIREAKKVQAYLAKGGKLSDLPPPPPSENPDYIQCPHCNRRFNESAAARHIPKCANMQHNKPKPPVQRKRY